jgi:hypothetical protein
MCNNCGINHATGELENEDSLSDFLTRLVASGGSDNTAEDTSVEEIAALLASIFGEPEAPVDYIAQHGLTEDFELNGTLNGKLWRVAVAEIPLDKIDEVDRQHGSQWWALTGYYDGEPVVSTEGAPPEPVTAKQAAEAYAEYHFDYVIPA